MSNKLGAPPALSTPESHILNHGTPVSSPVRREKRPTDDELITRYEIDRTIREIKGRKWRRIALQFPDEMLPDSARVFQLLARGLTHGESKPVQAPGGGAAVSRHQQTGIEGGLRDLDLDSSAASVKLTILADTSYGSCCVDEIAAEHVDADSVVHYGRACLSPTARLPVLHVFTKNQLDLGRVAESFGGAFPDLSTRVIVTADVTFANHVQALCGELIKKGYTNIFAASIVHDPSSPIPNRTVPGSVSTSQGSLRDWQLFHVSEPPTSLLLTLSSRVSSIRIYPTTTASTIAPSSLAASSTSTLLRRRYALLTSLTTVSTWGILINTLSVRNYLYIISHIRSLLSASGKKSYLFVVGKLNAAKVANFAEIGGWVVVGCWESSLVDSKDFYRPVVTPFELELCLRRDEERVWTGEWRGDFQGVLDQGLAGHSVENDYLESGVCDGVAGEMDDKMDGDYDSEEESMPPEFDLRTGRYVSQTRPTQMQIASSQTNGSCSSNSLVRKAKGDIVTVNGTASPGAEFLRSKRTWQGLGSDFVVAYEEEGGEREGGAMEEGRTGIARGYRVANSERH